MASRPGPRKPDLKQRQEAATALAISGLTFIASDAERLGRFLALTGIGPGSVRAAARQPDFLLGVLEHLAGNETLLLAFSSEHGFDPADLARARIALGGLPNG